MLATLPPDAARRVFGLTATPAPGPARPIGSYTKGCLAGAVEMPADGPDWQVMRPSRNRAWGHPALIAFLQRLAAAGRMLGWPGLLIGDMAQPRGGPMLTGHASHQLGIEGDHLADPDAGPASDPGRAQRDVGNQRGRRKRSGHRSQIWRPEHRRLLELAARDPAVDRIFVNPAIKRALCREVTGDRGWLHRIRPWFGHDYHFHVRLACPPRRIAVPEPGAAAARRRLRRRSRLVVHAGSQAAATDPARPTVAGFRPAAACAALERRLASFGGAPRRVVAVGFHP